MLQLALGESPIGTFKKPGFMGMWEVST